MAADRRVLTLNSGSSSLKFAAHRGEERLLAGQIDRVGEGGGRFTASGPALPTSHDEAVDDADHAAAVGRLLGWLRSQPGVGAVDAVGHRVVHGGPRHAAPARVTPELIEELRGLTPLAPNHLPAAVAVLEAAGRAFPGVPHVACFDTAFHRTLPPAARAVPVPGGDDVQRYGFHGLSYEYVVSRLREWHGPAAGGRAVIAHLGHGASLAAVRDGVGVDTTMGLTPTGGLVMSTRAGDLDPGVVVHLARTRGLTADQLDRVLAKESGLLALSGGVSDMRELLARAAAGDGRAALAIDVFCHALRKHVAAMAAALGGLDVLAFTAGIGEHSPEVRRRACDGLGFLGVRLDPARNAANEAVISADDSPVRVRVVPTDEELVIARHTAAAASTLS